MPNEFNDVKPQSSTPVHSWSSGIALVRQLHDKDMAAEAQVVTDLCAALDRAHTEAQRQNLEIARLRNQRDGLHEAVNRERDRGLERVAAVEKKLDAWDELRKAFAFMLGRDPEQWPEHGNAPLAITASFALMRQRVAQLEAVDSPERTLWKASRYDHTQDHRVRSELHALWQATHKFSVAMMTKLAAKALEEAEGWDLPDNRRGIANQLLEHAYRLVDGQPEQAVDVANLAMFLWWQASQRPGAVS